MANRTTLLAALLAASLVTASPALAAPDDALSAKLIAMERASWVAWQHHDGNFYRRFLSADHVEVHGGGLSDKADVVTGVGGGQCTVKSYAIDHFKFTRFDAGTALLIYRATQDTTCGPVKAPSPVWATSLYIFRGGRWVNAAYVHTRMTRPIAQ